MKAYLNGQEYAFEEGETILQLARRAGVFIPTLCRFEFISHIQNPNNIGNMRRER